MPLAVGDELWFDGAPGSVVAVTDTTDADGRGSVSRGSWEPSADYAEGRCDLYEGVGVYGRCTRFVARFWNQVLGVFDTDALLAAMESQQFPYDQSVLPAGASQVVGSDYGSAPAGSILCIDTTMSPETIGHVGIVHRYSSGPTKLANSNHVPPPDGDGLGYINLPADFSGTVFGWIAPPGTGTQFRALRAPAEGATEFPLVATDDPTFRVGLLLKSGSSPPLYALVLDDLPAPLGVGRRVLGAGGHWAEASSYARVDSVTFVMGRRLGAITIKQGGVTEADAFADLVLRYDTTQGAHDAWWEPLYPYPELADDQGTMTPSGALVGRFQTDANGVLCERAPDGTLGPIILPDGYGALGFRGEADAWPGAPTCDRTLTGIEVWCEEEHAAVPLDGGAVTLDVAACSLSVTAPAHTTIRGYRDDGYQRFGAGFGVTGGTTVVTGLAPGVYKVRCIAEVGCAYSYWPHQEVTIAASGASGSVTFGAGVLVAGGNSEGIAYAHGCAPQAGATVYGWYPGSGPPLFLIPPRLEVVATTSVGGAWSVAQPVPPWTAYVITGGHCACHPDVDWGSQFATDNVFCPVLGGCASAIRSVPLPPLFQEGWRAWGRWGIHKNLSVPARAAILRQRDSAIAAPGGYTGAVFYLWPGGSGHGTTSDPLPRYGDWTPTPGLPSGSSPPTAWTYDVFDVEDGAPLGSLAPASDGGSPWSDATGTMPWKRDTQGFDPEFTVGGKIAGNAVEADRSQQITVATLPEAFRQGLEWGRWDLPLDVRFGGALAEDEVPMMAFQGACCPYCGGPVWSLPDAAGYVRGFCVACADWSITTDGRTYFQSPTLRAVAWTTLWSRLPTSGGCSQANVTGWPRPEEYAEADDYLVADWQGFGVPRWVADHILFGTRGGGLFGDGESITDVEARLGRTVGPVRLKLLLMTAYRGSGKTVAVTATDTLSGLSVTTNVTIPAGALAGDLFPLSWAPHTVYPRGYYTDVTAVAEVSGEGALYCQVVNDGPAWHSTAGVAVTHSAQSPWACDLVLGVRDPHLLTERTGRVNLTYLRDGQIMRRTLCDPSDGYGEPQNISLRAGCAQAARRPRLTVLPWGRLLVCATVAGATRHFVSDDDGDHWREGVA